MKFEKLIKVDTKIKPYWEVAPDFLEPSGLKFSECDFSEFLEDRGLKNRLLETMVLNLPDGAYISGGAITSIIQKHPIIDIDMFFLTEKSFKETLRLFIVEAERNKLEEAERWVFDKYSIVTRDMEKFCQNSKDYRYIGLKHENLNRPMVQLLKLYWYDSPEQIIDSFDITVAQFIVGNDGIMKFNPMSFYDIANKKLVLHRLQWAGSTLRRIIKYSKKGYYACPGSLINIAEAINKKEKLENENEYMYVD